MNFKPPVIEVISVTCGANHTAAICKVESDTNSMQLYTWGNGINGALGHGDDLDRFEPEPVLAPYVFEEDFVSIAHRNTSRQTLLFRRKAPKSGMKMKKQNANFSTCAWPLAVSNNCVITTKASPAWFGGSGRQGVGDEEEVSTKAYSGTPVNHEEKQKLQKI